MKTLFIILSIILLAGVTDTYAQSFKVIVNESNSIESISKGDLSDIFLKKKTKWDNGSAVTPIDLKANSATRADFTQEVHGRNVGAIRSYWQQAAFSGAGTAPVERSNDADVIAFVKNNPGAVGYISVEAETSGVKILSIN